jgi:nucleotide-binding universal stress UspA family protein
MFHKILVAMDNSTSSQQVFEEALVLGKATEAQLMLLHVLSHDEEGCPESPYVSGIEYYGVMGDEITKSYHEQWQAYEQRGLEQLRSRADAAKLAGIDAEFTQIIGSPSRIICEMARNWAADLIVMGRRGRHGLSELILGSVSNYVTHHAHCSVLTVQGQVHPHLKLAEVNQVAATES